jgi:hypothetical protein
MTKQTFQHANDSAMGNLGYQRDPADAYFTPTWCTEALIKALQPFMGWRFRSETWWEPACGDGAISQVIDSMSSTDLSVVSTDLYDYGYGASPLDFLQTASMPTVDGDETVPSIITNPPYKLAEQFVRHALKLTERTKGAVCMLMRNEWDSARTRNDLFTRNTFAGKVVLTSRPQWIAGSTGSPRHNYAWFVWDNYYHHQQPPFLVYGHK